LNELLHDINPVDTFCWQLPWEKSRDPSPTHTKIKQAMLRFYWSSQISESFYAILIEDKGFLERINARLPSRIRLYCIRWESRQFLSVNYHRRIQVTFTESGKPFILR